MGQESESRLGVGHRNTAVGTAQSALLITFEQLVGITNGIVIDAEAAE